MEKYLSEVGVKELPNIFDKLSWVLKWQPLRWAGPYYEVLRGPEVSSLCIASLQRFGKSPIISILTLMIFFFCLVIATDWLSNLPASCATLLFCVFWCIFPVVCAFILFIFFFCLRAGRFCNTLLMEGFSSHHINPSNNENQHRKLCHQHSGTWPSWWNRDGSFENAIFLTLYWSSKYLLNTNNS